MGADLKIGRFGEGRKPLAFRQEARFPHIPRGRASSSVDDCDLSRGRYSGRHAWDCCSGGIRGYAVPTPAFSHRNSGRDASRAGAGRSGRNGCSSDH